MGTSGGLNRSDKRVRELLDGELVGGLLLSTSADSD